VGIAAPDGSPPDETPSQSLKHPGQIDPERTYRAAVDYLVDSGMDRKAAETRMQNQQQYVETAEKLRAQAPDDIQSAYINDNGELVVNVLTDKGVTLARKAGATPHQVSTSWQEMTEIQQQLAAEGGPGTTVGINPKSGKVEVSYSASKKAAAPLLNKAEQYGKTVTVTKKESTPQPAADIHPGDEIKIGERLCTAGWAIDIEEIEGGPGSATVDGIATAGHCLDENTPVEFNGQEAGFTLEANVGEDGDFGVVELNEDHNSLPTLLDMENPVIDIQRTMIVGSVVCKLGRTTDETCGEIVAVNDSITGVDADGTSTVVNGLVEASMCIKGGDSGAPVYTFVGDVTRPGAVVAMGIAVADNNVNGQCGSERSPAQPDESHFQPLDTVLPEDLPYELKLADSDGGSSSS
jgi:streptogrisin C